jgi:hypothetical protein
MAWDSPDALHTLNVWLKIAMVAFGLAGAAAAGLSIQVENWIRNLSSTADRDLRQRLDDSRKQSQSALDDAGAARKDAANARVEVTGARADATAARQDAALFREQLEAANRRIAELSPRVLSAQQRDALVTTLRAVPSEQRRLVMVMATTLDGEQRQLAEILAEALGAAGWTAPVSQNMMPPVPAGLHLVFAPDDQASATGQALRRALGNMANGIHESGSVRGGTVWLVISTKPS